MNKSILFLLILLLACSCARESSPTGGSKDEQAPVTYDSLAIPTNYSINFNSNNISIPFNEYITIKDPFRNILISPPLEEKPEFRTKGKSLYIDLKENKLHPNTTYIINFGEAIEDITEGNKALNLKYIFSTGPTLDSLVVKGKVVDAVSLLPVEKVSVMLYNSNIDSLPYKKIPNYYAITDKDGKFEITHVHSGTYKIFGLKDQNFSLTYDLQTEEIAFTDSLIIPEVPDSNSAPLDLRLFLENFDEQYLTKYTLNYPGFVELNLNNPTQSPELIPLKNSPLPSQKEYSKNKDTIKYWFSNLSELDSIFYLVADGDSIIDTIGLDPKRDLSKTKSKDSLTWVSNGKANFDLFDTLKFTFSQPIINFDTTLIKFEKDSLPVNYNYEIGGNANRTLNIWSKWEQQSLYEIKILPKALSTLYDLYNDTIYEGFKTQENAFYGKLIVAVLLETYNLPFIITLIDEGGKIIDEQVLNSSNKLTFPNLYPTKFTLKLLYDINGNGRWDPGRYLEHLPPERIIYFNEEISIQSGWDSEIQWVTNDRLLKNNTTEIDSLNQKDDSIPEKK